MKKICLILPNILPVPNVSGGAIETLISNLIYENEIFHKIDLVVFSVYNLQALKLSKELKYTQIFYIKKAFLARIYSSIVFRLNRYFNIVTPFTSLYYHKTYLNLKKINPDFIIAEGGEYYNFRKISEYFGKEKVYLHIHHHLLPDKIMDNIFNNTIGTSMFVSKEWSENSSNLNLKSNILYNCVDEAKFNKRISIKNKLKIREELGLYSNDFIVIYCGRIIEEKGVKELIQAFGLITEKHIKLLIIGSPNFALNTESEYLNEVKQLINEVGDKIKFSGYIPNEQLYKYYQSVNVQVVPSIWEEAAGLVLIEGMLSGLPLIITKSGGMGEYASPTCSIQLERDQDLVNNIAQSIMLLYSDKDIFRRMQKESLKQARNFTKEKFYFDFTKIFQKD